MKDVAGTLPAIDLDSVSALVGVPARANSYRENDTILRPGDTPEFAHVLLAGLACRYRMLRSGRRQITAILVPGDLCDLEAAMRGVADYGLSALSTCTFAEFSVGALRDDAARKPNLTLALLHQSRQSACIAAEWIVGLGGRSAVERLAHLLCELHARLAAVGLATEDRFTLPISREVLADALGLSVVHVHRALEELRRKQLIAHHDGAMIFLDHSALEKLADFDPTYLS